MKQKFFSDKFMRALCRSYLVPCTMWGKDDEEFYTRNILPVFRRFMKDLLPRLKKCDGSVNDNLKEILITCANRSFFELPTGEFAEVGAIITQQQVVAGMPVEGMVFGFTPKKIVLAGGIFGIENQKLEQIKGFLTEQNEKYVLLQDNEDFSESFGKEGFCRPTNPLGVDTCAEGLVLNTGFVGCVGHIPARFITDDILPDIIIAHYKGIKAVNRFLNKALKPLKVSYEITV